MDINVTDNTGPDRQDVRAMRYGDALDGDIFWQFVRDYGRTSIGYEHSTVMREARAMLALTVDAVFLYKLKMHTETPEVYSAVMSAEKKILWLNRKCHELTGRYFFTGRLLRDEKGGFCIESAYELCYEVHRVLI